MGIGSGFKKLGSYLWNNLKKVAGITVKQTKEVVIEDFKQLAKLSAESVSGIDFDGDGRIVAINEIVEMAERTAESWGKKLLVNGKEQLIQDLGHYLNHDLQRYLALSRFVLNILQAGRIVPRHKVLNGILEVVLNELEDELDVRDID